MLAWQVIVILYSINRRTFLYCNCFQVHCIVNQVIRGGPIRVVLRNLSYQTANRQKRELHFLNLPELTNEPELIKRFAHMYLLVKLLENAKKIKNVRSFIKYTPAGYENHVNLVHLQHQQDLQIVYDSSHDRCGTSILYLQYTQQIYIHK